MREFLGDINAFHLADQDFCAFRHIDSGKRRNRMRSLTDNLRIDRTIDDNSMPNFVKLFILEEVAAACGEFFFHLVIDFIQHDCRLLRSADHAVIKGFGVDNRIDGKRNIGSIVNDRRRIASADSDCRFAAGICCMNHARTARCEYDIRIFHNGIGHIQRGFINPADNTFRRTSLIGGFRHNFCRGNGCLFCARMRRDDDAVSSFEGDQRFKNSR